MWMKALRADDDDSWIFLTLLNSSVIYWLYIMLRSAGEITFMQSSRSSFTWVPHRGLWDFLPPHSTVSASSCKKYDKKCNCAQQKPHPGFHCVLTATLDGADHMCRLLFFFWVHSSLKRRWANSQMTKVWVHWAMYWNLDASRNVHVYIDQSTLTTQAV